MLSIRAKEAIKVGLAMAITYGIALQMDWDRPYWAAFAVAFISLATTGQSLRKGVLRMSGILVAGVAALTIIALFPQERWWFMATLSVYIGFCTYRMTGSKNPYFYQVSAFVCVIICFDGDAQSLQAFQTTVIRIQETGLGILVYSLKDRRPTGPRVRRQLRPDDKGQEDLQERARKLQAQVTGERSN